MSFPIYSYVPSRQPPQGNTPFFEKYPKVKKFTKNVIVPMGSAALAIVPTYELFDRKTYGQLGEKAPQYKFFKSLRGGIGAGPSIALVVGVPAVAQTGVEKIVQKAFGHQGQKATGYEMALSAAIVGALSIAPLAIFNGRTRKMTWRVSLENLCRWQCMSLIFRETSFLLSIAISSPLGSYMRSVSNDSKVAEYGSVFMTGAIGSLVNHPADTIFTRLQNKKSLEDPRQILKASTKGECISIGKRVVRQLYAGGLARAGGVGGLLVFYTMNKKEFNSWF